MREPAPESLSNTVVESRDHLSDQISYVSSQNGVIASSSDCGHGWP